MLTLLQENGVQTAIHTIYRHLGYARSLIKTRANDTEELEDGWLLIGDDAESFDFNERLPRMEIEEEVEEPTFGPSFAPSLELDRESDSGEDE